MTPEDLKNEIARLLGPEEGPKFSQAVDKRLDRISRHNARMSNPAYIRQQNERIAERSIGCEIKIQESKGVFFVGTIVECVMGQLRFVATVESKNGTRRKFTLSKLPQRRKS